MNSSRAKMRDRNILPPLSESPFGSFPAEWRINGENGSDHVYDNTKIHCFTQPPVHYSNNNKHKLFINCSVAPRKDAMADKATNATRFNNAQNNVVHSKVDTCHTGSSEDTNNRRMWPVSGPGIAGAYKIQKIPPTTFRIHYERSDLPLCIQHAATRSLQWKVNVKDLDYHHYMPIFFDGLREIEEPFAFVACEGSMALIEHGGHKILPTIPQLIMPMKLALNTRHPLIVYRILKILQKLILSSDFVGEALVPYYRQLLPVLNLFKNKTQNFGDHIDFRQNTQSDICRIVNETLTLLEQYGGEDAYINIKYIIPTYESCK